MRKVVFVVSSPETISSFLLPYIHRLSTENDVHVVCTLEDGQTIRGLNEDIPIHNINIARAPRISADLRSLYHLFQLFKNEKFDVLYSYTPKAGLLSQISAFAARTDKRIHTFTGQVWVTRKGISKWFMKSLDKITAKLTTFCLVDSPSQRDFLLSESVVNTQNSAVLKSGSVSGVNLNRFNFSPEQRYNLREQLNFTDKDFVFMFVGRLNAEKGVPELVEAFNKLLSSVKHEDSIKLVVIGSDEAKLSHILENNKNIKYLGFQSNVQDYYSFADILCLPSHREGFGNVIIEAAACSLPSIASNIYGLSDAVEDGLSGFLHEVANSDDIAKSMKFAVNNRDVIEKMRKDARKRAETVFDENLLVDAFVEFFDKHGKASK